MHSHLKTDWGGPGARADHQTESWSGLAWLLLHFVFCWLEAVRVQPGASWVQRTRNFSASFILLWLYTAPLQTWQYTTGLAGMKKVWISSFSINYQPSSSFLQSTKNAHSFLNFMLCLKIEYRKYLKSWLVFLGKVYKASSMHFGLDLFFNVRSRWHFDLERLKNLILIHK